MSNIRAFFDILLEDWRSNGGIGVLIMKSFNRIALFFVVSLILGLSTFVMLQDIEGQDNITALQKKLQETTNDSMKVVYLNQIALSNINLTQNDTAVVYAQRALEIAETC